VEHWGHEWKRVLNSDKSDWVWVAVVHAL
jgi:hypothetical protein